MANSRQSYDDDHDYNVDEGRHQPKRIKPNLRHRTARYSRHGSGPTIYNGMHRRRRRRPQW